MADKVINKKNALTGTEVIDNLLDRQLVDLLNELPDPDVILRKAGIDYAVYNEILADAHVIGEVRPLRAGLLGFKHEIKAGDDSPQADAARELCENIFTRQPNSAMRWPDITWSIGLAPLVGRRVHHVKWQVLDGKLVPEKLFDISTESYAFNADGELLIRTIRQPEGEPPEPYRWLVTRHMPTRQNPYGLALLSCCFWPWMFKNGGMKFFVKFCEKYGVPWPIGKYPQGTDDKGIAALVERLQSMLEDAVAAIPEDVDLSLLETKTSGELPQERLVNLCNREMSKALTSQSLSTEIIDGGSRAAAETHAQRTVENLKADRTLVADTYNELFKMITEVNFGPNVEAPKYKYVDKKELNTGDVNFFKQASTLVPVRREDIYKRLELSEPTDGEDVVFTGNQQRENTPGEQAQFSKAEDEWTEQDIAIEQIINQVKQAIDSGDTLEEVLANIVSSYADLDTEALRNVVTQELEGDFGRGMVSES
ncbi:phage portal protein family protein [Alteromonas alba]|nr:DUF935 family protein [Alteromonas alba]